MHLSQGPSAHNKPQDIGSVPRRPGVYVFHDSRQKVLYVGKAKDLRARLSSYFRKSPGLDNRKLRMVSLVRGFNYIVTSSELEALALEANLIKQHRPPYNVILRDDKNYPYLRVAMDDPWPRIDVVRRVRKDGALYFGPYVHSGAMWEALRLVNRAFGVRPCRYRLDRPMRPCVQHQMGRCEAPCAGLVGRERYMEGVGEAVEFLRGRRAGLLLSMRQQMMRASDELRFEDAASLRDRIALLEQAFDSQRVIAPELGDVDVMGLWQDGGGDAAAHVLLVREGVMTGAREYYLKGAGLMPPDELMYGFVEMFYARGEAPPPPRVLVSHRPHGRDVLAEWLGGLRGGGVALASPTGGIRAELVRMASDNARLHLESRLGKAGAVEAMMAELARELSLAGAPGSIGAFDVSNIQGAEPTGGYVYWAGGEFRKDNYRHIHIRDVQGPDDYAMMRELVKRVMAEPGLRADLIVIDGGRGHLDAALSALGEMGLSGSGCISLAKRPDRVFVPAQEGALVELDRRVGRHRLLMRIRDEVHRFCLALHRKQRGRRFGDSPLEGVPGIGKARRVALLRAFGSLEGIRGATVQELAAVQGMTRPVAEALMEMLHRDGRPGTGQQGDVL